VSELDIASAARELRARVEACKRIWVTVHESPDGDSIGAALALAGVVRRLGKRVVAVRQPPFPAQYERLPGAADMVDVGALEDVFQPEMVVACDVGSFRRIGAVLGYVGPHTHVVNIDHHPGNGGPEAPCRLLNLVEPTVASTTMLLYLLLREAWPDCIGPDEASCLYVGLITDTGCFRHSNTDARALQVAAELAALGADSRRLPEDYMFRRRAQTVRLLAEVLSTLVIHAGGRFATLVLSEEMLQRTGARADETEGFVNYATSIDGVQVAALFRESDPRMSRVSLRSTNFVDVAQIAAEFGGGGHRNAAGCTLTMDLAAARARVAEAVARHLEMPAARGEA
jgi:phosphoesterase RecJ-like protein